ncbi:hypothetical protein evm_001852 [Chilo suppressalis]|nr:hypothetical protein evm_001852 [Chilo suppressalis]
MNRLMMHELGSVSKIGALVMMYAFAQVRCSQEADQTRARRELQRKYETEQKRQELKDIAAGRGEDYAYGNFGEQEPRGLQPLQMEYPSDEPSARHNKKPPSGSRQVSQFSRYSDVMLPPVRRTFYHPYYDYVAPEFLQYY